MKVKKVKSQNIISIRRKCSPEELKEIIGQSMMEIFQYIGEKGVNPRGPPVAIFHESNEKEIDFEAGIPVSGKVTGEKRIKLSETPKGKALYTLYEGALDKIAPVYDEMMTWAKIQGLKSTGLWWERYLTDPRKEPDQTKWKTEIYYQVL